MNNHRINNTQRKVFANLAEQTLDRKVQEARDASGKPVAKITAQVKQELGIDTIDNQIDALETQIETLKKQKESLGFSRWKNDPVPIVPGSQAKQLIDSRTNTTNQKIRDLQEKRTEYIAKIWAATTLDEAMELLDEVRAL